MAAIDVATAATASPLAAKYGTRLDRESAAEVLARRVEAAPPPEDDSEPEPEPAPKRPRGSRPRAKKAKEPTGGLTDFLSSRQGKALEREVVRGVFGLLKKRL
jgi:hypothetical protein